MAKVRLFPWSVLFVLSACGVDDMAPVLAQKPKPPIARFTMGDGGGAEPAFLDVPFPSDLYMKDGHFVGIGDSKRVFKRGGGFISDQIATLDGWSRIAGAMFVVDDPKKDPNPDTLEPATAVIDRTTLPADEKACAGDASSVWLFDMDDGKRVPCRSLFHDESQIDNGRSYVVIGPARGVVLAEGHHYCAVLTSRVKDESGKAVTASDEFTAAAVRKEGPLAAVYGAAYDKVMGFASGALGGDRIVALAPYTTQKVIDELYTVRDALEAASAPALSWDAASLAPMGASKFARYPLPAGFTATLDAWLGVAPADKKLPDGTDDPDDALPFRAHDKIAAVGTAVFDAVNYLQVKNGKYDEIGHATFAHDASGKPIPAPEKPTSKIWITFAVPDAPMPATGYPVVIIQHGLSSSRAYMMTMANTFAKKGWMSVAIDSVTFGARAVDPKFQVDTTTDWIAAPGATYNGPDGMADLVETSPGTKERAGSTDFFGTLKNILALRDQLRQAEVDTAQVVKVLRSNPDLTALKTGADAPKIDPERIAYVGDSLGAIEGSVAAAIEPNVKAWTLNVGGGGVLTELAAHGPVVNVNLALAGTLNFGLTGAQYSEGHFVVLLGQAIEEAGDPIAYADKMVTSPMPVAGAPTKPRNLLQVEVLYDELVANEADEALARAGGWLLATPNVGTNAGTSTLSPPTPYRGGGIELGTVMPDGDGFHDTPLAGVTALVAQVGPASHGADLVRSRGSRQYAIPFNDKDGKLVVDRQTDPFDVPCPYRELQASMVGFFDDAFAGKVPSVKGLPEPKRDLDGDGATDDVDPAPIDATKK